jgi:RNA polymerase sigma-70 factor (ECF subfamily)
MSKTPPIQYNSQTDEQLAELCNEHDNLAFQELMQRYLKQIFNFSRQYSKTVEDSEDITQDTFFKVWRYIGKYKKGKTFKPWIYTIARNTALDHIKKKKAYSFSELEDSDSDFSFVDTLEDTEPLPPENYENVALSKQLLEKMEHIHPDHRIIIMLHYKEEMTFEEIAQVVNKPMNTVKSWHRRAVMQLRELLKDPDQSPTHQ